VVCPSSLRIVWAEAFEKWVPALGQSRVGCACHAKPMRRVTYSLCVRAASVVYDIRSELNREVTIISYDMVVRLSAKLKQVCTCMCVIKLCTRLM
jgi:hypothetical protein